MPCQALEQVEKDLQSAVQACQEAQGAAGASLPGSGAVLRAGGSQDHEDGRGGNPKCQQGIAVQKHAQRRASAQLLPVTKLNAAFVDKSAA